MQIIHPTDCTLVAFVPSVQALYPSCDALKEAGILTADGDYLIDVDGPNSGERPSIVRCEEETGK